MSTIESDDISKPEPETEDASKIKILLHVLLAKTSATVRCASISVRVTFVHALLRSQSNSSSMRSRSQIACAHGTSFSYIVASAESCGGSLVAEGFHRIDVGGAAGRDVASDQRGGDQDERCNDERQRIEGADLEELALERAVKNQRYGEADA
jgi:hypothetical protein